jgi:membrane protein YdbS with pleckstrin-like domain
MLQEQQRNQSLESTGRVAIASQRVVSRGPAIWTTVIALALVNVGAAATIVALTRPDTFWPLWVGLVVTAVGVVTLALAVSLWRHYLHELRGPAEAEARHG